MRNKHFGKNLFYVAFSRLVSLASGVLVGLLLPKVFTITDYGYYKVFTLYAAYTALLHFGFVDGLLLALAGKEYDSLNKEKIRTYTRFFWGFECIVAGVMLAVGAFFLKGESRFLLVMLSANTLLVNLTTYYQFLSQAVQRFGDYSAKTLLVSLIRLCFVVILFGIYLRGGTAISYRIYLLGLSFFDLLMLIWYVVIYREITFGKRLALPAVKKEIYSIFKTGITLTLAYQVSHIILALDRQFVSILFPTETFAKYSFAYSIVSMVSTMISSLSVVLLPMLKSKTREYVVGACKKCVTIIAILASGALVCYYPFALFVDWFLPDYHDSLQYIAIVLPTFLFTSVISVVIFTVAKVLNMNFEFLKDSCLVLLAGVLANVVAYCLVKAPEAISYASLLVMILWLFIAGNRMKRKIGVRIYRQMVYLIGVAVIFLITAGVHQSLLHGCLSYLILLVSWTGILYAGDIRRKICRKSSRQSASTPFMDKTKQ